MVTQWHDVLVVGGGAAGLGGALTLARARRSVLVVHDGAPRNAPAAHMHAYLGLDGLPPGELLARGRAEVEGYGAEVVEDRVVDVRRDGDGFRAALAGGRVVRARRVLVATGLVDVLPDVPGLAERWGRDVLHCPFCHGWEVRDRAIAVLGSGPVAVHQAQLWRGWTADVTLFLGGAAGDAGGDGLSDADWELLAALGVRVVDGPVAGLEVADDVLTGVRLATGTVLACDAVVVATRMGARLDGLAGLALPTEEVTMGERVLGTRVSAAPDGSTTVPGVRVAGNVTDLRAQVQVAAAAGLTAGAALVAELAAEDADAAVARYRAEQAAPFSARAEREVAALRTRGGAVGL
jgi:thioredoxin reductase